MFCAGPGSKRLGIDGDREAIPLTLQIAYSKVSTWDWHRNGAENHLSGGQTRLCWGANGGSVLEEPEYKPRRTNLKLIAYLLANWG